MVSRFLQSRSALAISFLLVGAVLLVYGQTGWFDFTSLDDSYYIYENPMVIPGLTSRGLLWGLTTSFFDCWHPLTWWSHMLDCQLFGLNAGLHHLESALFHAANTVLVFSVFRRMTGRQARAAVVAALFALHPTHVESVAWAAERKDVLSTFFALLAMWAYVRYFDETRARAGMAEATPAREGTSPRAFYALSLLFFGLGLMAKPMVVTLPCILLLLDFWPLRRFTDLRLRLTDAQTRRLLLEKAPYFALAFLSSAVTYWNMSSGENLVGSQKISLGLRLANVPVSYARYLGKLFWPAGLIPYYPLPGHWAAWRVAAAVVLLAAVTFVVFSCRRRAPFMLVGWLWFLGALVPVIGVVAMSYQSMADRYLYVPSIGIFVAVVWLAADVTSACHLPRAGLRSVTALVLAALGCAAWTQVRTWRNTTTLWEHCLKLSPENGFAQNGIGCLLQQSGRFAEARDHFREAIRLGPPNFFAWLNLGVACASLGDYHEATNCFARAMEVHAHYGKAPADMAGALFILEDYAGAATYYEEAVELDPRDAKSLTGLGRAWSKLGRSDDAARAFQDALAIDPTFGAARYHLGLEYLKRGELDQAIEALQQVMDGDPDSASAHLYLASALQKQHKTADALAQYREAIRLDPKLLVARNNLAWILATHPKGQFRDGVEAVQMAQAACEQTHYAETIFVGTLAAAYAEAGQFDQAAAMAQKACDLARAAGQEDLLARNQRLLRQYQNHEPCRDSQ